MIREWFRKKFRRHYEKSWDGWNATCACGFRSNQDPFLEHHFWKVEQDND